MPMLLSLALTSHIAHVEPGATEIEYPKHLLEEWRVEPEKDGLLFSPVTFTTPHVHQSSVATMTALVLDYDDGTAPEDAAEPWLDFDFVLYSTHSHEPEAPRFRIVLPFAAPVSPEPFRAIWKWASARAVGRIDPTCKDLFRRYYWPSHKPGSEHFAVHNTGRKLALEDAGVSPSSPVVDAKAKLLARAAVATTKPSASIFAGIGQGRGVGIESVDAIESRCGFMAHARDDAATLGEPEWYAAISVWDRCREGEALVHERSKPHAGYDAEATAAKLIRARAHGPATCARIGELVPDTCRTCPHFGKLTSPVQLGKPDADTDHEAAAEHANATLSSARVEHEAAKERVENARAALREKKKDANGIADPTERAAHYAPESRAVIDAIELRDRAASRVKSAEREARGIESAGTPPEGAAPAVWASLKLNAQSGAPTNCYSNVFKIVRLDPKLGATLRTNDLGDVPEWNEKPFAEGDASTVTEYIADSYGLEARLSDVHAAIDAVANANHYNPAAEYLDGLPTWDRKERAGELLANVLHVESGNVALYETYLRRTLIGAVRRALVDAAPGVKVDTMLVLQGKQGIQKSAFFAALFGPAFTHDTPFEIGNKDAYGQLAYGWCYEWGELSGLGRKEIESVKAFLASLKDTYRSPFARRASVHYRHTVFGGTTNQATPLNDPTGARRFWIIPVPPRKIDLAYLATIRDQVWAEALYYALVIEEPHWLSDGEDAEQERDAEQFNEEDPWRAPVSRWVSKRVQAFASSDLFTVLGMPPDRQDGRAIRKLCALLRDLGCASHSAGGGKVRLWHPPFDADRAVEAPEAGNEATTGKKDGLFHGETLTR